jgi:hypothetical protein
MRLTVQLSLLTTRAETLLTGLGISMTEQNPYMMKPIRHIRLTSPDFTMFALLLSTAEALQT